jgi:hypothetical protein
MYISAHKHVYKYRHKNSYSYNIGQKMPSMKDHNSLYRRFTIFDDTCMKLDRPQICEVTLLVTDEGAGISI